LLRHEYITPSSDQGSFTPVTSYEDKGQNAIHVFAKDPGIDLKNICGGIL